ncbi:MAG: hypothetical protein JWN66_3746 [Sphingomonas bacterium]|uniref:hypothetical protein n=1 Tax=Sphingomonas bacterium TaxID=1895847 RepID=UPI002634051C|nr:hypothetical protein [Sphingomonas bacterium]MDB5706630.1 hypothetical protein [Sphingomonas bacterium]
MKALALAVLGCLAFVASPLRAQDDSAGGGEIVVTGMRNSLSGPATVIQQPPVIGLKRTADSAVRTIEIVSDSREEGMRKREVQAMLLDAIDRAKRDGFSLVTGQFELVEVTRANWQDQFPALAGKVDTIDADDDDDDDNKQEPAFEDVGSTATVRLKVKTKLDGSIGNAQQKINGFVKSVPATGRSQIEQKGELALTIINPEQYRDEIYRRIAAGSKHAVTFYGPEYGLEVTGLDQSIAWKQVSNTEVFLYIPYGFSIRK